MSEMLVPELQIYWAAAAALAALTVGFVWWSFALEERLRPYGLAVALVSASVSFGYVLMARGILTVIEGGNRLPFGRFVGYVLLFGIVVVLIWRISDAGRLWLAVMLVATYVWIGSVVVNWLASGTLEQLSLAGILVSFVVEIAVFLGPLSTAARETAGERRLLFGKLRNLTVMVLVLYLAVSVVSDQNLGLLDTFVGVFTVVYLDVVFVTSFGAILLRAETAIEQVVGEPAEAATSMREDGEGVTVAESTADAAE